MIRVGLIDGDIVAYRAAFVAEADVEWEPGQWTKSADEDIGKQKVDEFLVGIRDRLKLDRMTVALSDTENFRKAIWPAYKAPRGKVRKPILLQRMKDYISEEYGSVIMPTLEADDVLGILATSPQAGHPERRVIVSMDKDLKQIPGWIFNPSKDKKPRKVTEHQADYEFFTQVLTGDVTDNYPGCPGIGKVKAEKLLGGPQPDNAEHWVNIVAAYEKAGLHENDAIIQARVARILRYGEYEDGKVKLWATT